MAGQDLGYRKIQSVGRSSYVISLPKRWVVDNGLDKGSQLAFRVQEDSSLVLIPRKILESSKEAKSRLKKFKLQVSSKDDPKSICRKIISLYVISADLIHVKSENGGFTFEHKAAINSLVRNVLLGSEIIEETPNEITLQILINHPDFPIERAIRRMFILALSANNEAISSLKSMDESSIRNVIETYQDVNRLNLYAIRQLKFGIERKMFKELGFKSPKEFLGYRIVTNDIKSIAKNAMNIAKNILNLKKMIDNQVLILNEPVDEEIYSQILQFNSFAHQMFEDSLKALFKRDYELADKTISQLDSSTSLENDLVNLMSTKKLDPNISSILRLILDSSRRIMEYSRNIAEVTLNRTIEEITVQRINK